MLSHSIALAFSHSLYRSLSLCLSDSLPPFLSLSLSLTLLFLDPFLLSSIYFLLLSSLCLLTSFQPFLRTVCLHTCSHMRAHTHTHTHTLSLSFYRPCS